MTMFRKMYHPQLGNRQVDVAEQAIDDQAARGWLLVDGSTPTPSVPYLTPTLADSRYLRTDDVDDPGTPSGVALRAAFVPADPVLSDFVYTDGNLTSYKEDGVTITLTYNADGTVATSKRGTAATKTYSYSGGNLAGVA